MVRIVSPCARLCGLLRILSESLPDDGSFSGQGLRRYEMAQAQGMSREHLSRIVARMKRRGVLVENDGVLRLRAVS